MLFEAGVPVLPDGRRTVGTGRKEIDGTGA